MPITMKITKYPKKRSIKYRNTSNPDKLLKLLMLLLKRKIITRTLSGKDYKNKQFKKYAATSYKAGRRVNLKLSGLMLNSLRVRIIDNVARIVLTNHADIGYYHNLGAGNLPKRLWFALSSVTIRNLFNRFRKQVQLK